MAVSLRTQFLIGCMANFRLDTFSTGGNTSHDTLIATREQEVLELTNGVHALCGVNASDGLNLTIDRSVEIIDLIHRKALFVGSACSLVVKVYLLQVALCSPAFT
eukprot:4237450-Ditylum_brightwellii.AAC.1